MKKPTIRYIIFYFVLVASQSIVAHDGINNHFISNTDVRILDEEINHALVYINESIRSNIIKLIELAPHYEWSAEFKHLCQHMYDGETIAHFEQIAAVLDECLAVCNICEHEQVRYIRSHLDNYKKKLHAGKAHIQFSDTDKTQLQRNIRKICEFTRGCAKKGATGPTGPTGAPGQIPTNVTFSAAATVTCNGSQPEFLPMAHFITTTTIGITPFVPFKSPTTAVLLADDCFTGTLNFALVPKGDGGLFGAAPDNTTVGGNERGAYAIDWQLLRDDPTEVASGDSSVISGGYGNIASGDNATVGGGAYGTASADYAVIGGGYKGNATGFNSSVCGGDNSNAAGDYSAVCGGEGCQALGDYSFMGSGYFNTAGGDYSAVAGGNGNNATTAYASVGGGYNNTASNSYATVCGGNASTASGLYSLVCGGAGNTAPNVYSTVCGGAANNAFNELSTIGGGENNTASGVASTISGGAINTASGDYSIIPGGQNNQAHGDYSFAAGFEALATGTGSFVWSDSTGTTTDNTANQFIVGASGGVIMYTDASPHSMGAQLAPGSTAWTAVSDRTMKTNIQDIDEIEILEKLMKVPVQSWNYKSQDASIRHIGPMAQDFNPAFGFNETPLGISTLDFDGVALAAIQGLYKLQNIKMSAMEDRLKHLEHIIAIFSAKKNES